MRRNVSMVAMLFFLVFASAGCEKAAPAAANTPSTKAAEDLAAEVKALKELIPDQAHIMADVGYHFTNLWFAGTAENWPLADFYLGETKSHLRWAVRAKPMRRRQRRQGREPSEYSRGVREQSVDAIEASDRAQGQAVVRDSVQGEPDDLLCVPQGFGQTVSPSASSYQGRCWSDQLRPEGRLASLARFSLEEGQP